MNTALNGSVATAIVDANERLGYRAKRNQWIEFVGSALTLAYEEEEDVPVVRLTEALWNSYGHAYLDSEKDVELYFTEWPQGLATVGKTWNAVTL